MSFNKDVPVQLHYQLANELRSYIQNGQLSIGDYFPTDREIMTKYNVSGTTVRRAVLQLVKEGWLNRRPGKGTFIKKEPLEEQLGQLTGFFEEMRNKGFEPKADIISAGVVEVSTALLKQLPSLQAFQENSLILIEKIHKVNEQPVVYVKSFWRQKYGEKLLEFDLHSEGTYVVAAKRLGVKLTRADETIAAGAASAKEAHYLSVRKNAPVLLMERLAYIGEELVEFSYNAYRADRYRYHIVLYKDQPAGRIILVP